MNTHATALKPDVPLAQQPEVSSPNQGNWFAILTVAITAFALVTSEFLPIGVLNAIALDLKISVGTAGWVITLPGIMGIGIYTNPKFWVKLKSMLFNLISPILIHVSSDDTTPS